MNIVDRVINVFSPQTALKRTTARRKMNILNTGYSHHGASKTKKSLIGWNSKGGSTKEDIDDNLKTLRERSRDLYMGIPLATGALKTMRTNVVGSGLRLNSQIDYEFLGMSEEQADEWETTVEREFSLWADSVHCDMQRMFNFYELQQLAFLSFLMNGDTFATLPVLPRKQHVPYDLRIQLLEADRVCDPDKKPGTNEIVNGVECDKNGEIVAYYIAKFHPLSTQMNKKEWVRIDKYGKKTGRLNIIHLMEAERPEQKRGVPVLAPVIESLKQLGRYTEAELMAAVVSGMFTVFVKTETGDIELGEMVSEEQQVAPDDDTSYELGYGAMIALGEGEDVKETNPGRPNTAFDGFVTSICRQIGVALELPYEILIKHFTASYSASRGALLEAWKMFRMRRTWFANKFCQPIYEEWLTEAIATGRVDAPGFFSDPLIRKAYCGSEWNGPSQGQIDPLKEVTAAAKRVEEGFSTRSRETVELTGGDYYQNIRQRVVEEQMRKDGGLIDGRNKS